VVDYIDSGTNASLVYEIKKSDEFTIEFAATIWMIVFEEG
jgi:hypothetical protein